MSNTTAPEDNPNSASPHTSSAFLGPFISTTTPFDPTAYLNSKLPSLGIPTTQQPILSSKLTSLSELVSASQTHLAELSAQESRLVSTLTTLTDEILRSGSRLAYEVELLRGEAGSLEEALSGALKEDVARFVPEAPTQEPTEARDSLESDLAKLAVEPAGADEDVNDADVDEDGDGDGDVEESSTRHQPSTPAASKPAAVVDPLAPPALARLRTLQHVRASLQAVISTFDAALSFPLPPSLLTQTSSASAFVSVAAPADPALEAAGQEALARLRASIFDHLDVGKGGEGGSEGLRAAEKTVGELRELCRVWKGTSEEKARLKVLEGWERELGEARERLGVRKSAEVGREQDERSTEAGRDAVRSKGLFGGLRRLGDKIYLE